MVKPFTGSSTPRSAGTDAVNAEPTPVERRHYAKLIGWLVLSVEWEDMEGRPLPVLVLGRNGQKAEVAVLCDPEGNGPGHLDHRL